jgi:hypothetical protein
MKKWMLALVVAGIGALGVAQAGGYSYGAGGGGCCDPCGMSCDPCCQSCNPCCDSCCDPCCDPCCGWEGRGGGGGFGLWGDCGGFEVLGEYLYLRPHVCDLNYAIEDPRDGNSPTSTTPTAPSDMFLPLGKEHGIQPDYQSGFRVGLAYLFNCGCNDVEVDYQRLKTCDRSHIRNLPSSFGIWVTQGHPSFGEFRLNNASTLPAINGTTVIAFPGATATPFNAFAVSRVSTRYQFVDGVVATRSMKSCDLWVRGFVGIRWADFRWRHRDIYGGIINYLGPAFDIDLAPVTARYYANAFSHLRNKSHTWGVGPRFGADIRYEVLCGFGVGAHVGAAILAGEADHHIFQLVQITNLEIAGVVGATPGVANTSTPLIVRDHCRCVLFPEIDARLGLNYLWCCGSCFSLLVEVGWEFESYINAIGHIRFTDTGTNHEFCDSFNLDGLYVMVRLTI